jgi:hypothetical protein
MMYMCPYILLFISIVKDFLLEVVIKKSYYTCVYGLFEEIVILIQHYELNNSDRSFRVLYSINIYNH